MNPKPYQINIRRACVFTLLTCLYTFMPNAVHVEYYAQCTWVGLNHSINGKPRLARDTTFHVELFAFAATTPIPRYSSISYFVKTIMPTVNLPRTNDKQVAKVQRLPIKLTNVCKITSILVALGSKLIETKPNLRMIETFTQVIL